MGTPLRRRASSGSGKRRRWATGRSTWSGSRRRRSSPSSQSSSVIGQSPRSCSSSCPVRRTLLVEGIGAAFTGSYAGSSPRSPARLGAARTPTACVGGRRGPSTRRLAVDPPAIASTDLPRRPLDREHIRRRSRASFTRGPRGRSRFVGRRTAWRTPRACVTWPCCWTAQTRKCTALSWPAGPTSVVPGTGHRPARAARLPGPHPGVAGGRPGRPRRQRSVPRRACRERARRAGCPARRRVGPGWTRAERGAAAELARSTVTSRFRASMRSSASSSPISAVTWTTPSHRDVVRLSTGAGDRVEVHGPTRPTSSEKTTALHVDAADRGSHRKGQRCRVVGSTGPTLYERHGDGEPVVLVQAARPITSAWLVVNELAQTNQVVTYDRRGHSRSERGPSAVVRRVDEDDPSPWSRRSTSARSTSSGAPTARRSPSAWPPDGPKPCAPSPPTPAPRRHRHARLGVGRRPRPRPPRAGGGRRRVAGATPRPPPSGSSRARPRPGRVGVAPARASAGQSSPARNESSTSVDNLTAPARAATSARRRRTRPCPPNGTASPS